jgi:hypothetical protein
MKVIRSSHGEFQTDERGLIVPRRRRRSRRRCAASRASTWPSTTAGARKTGIVPAEVIDIVLVGLWYADADGEDYEPPEVLARECLVLELVDATEATA